MLDLKNTPTTPGIYLMKDNTGSIIYVGKAKNLRKRLANYFSGKTDLHIKIQNLIKKIDDFEYIVTKTDKEAYILENRYIKNFNPKYNTRLKDSKTYPYLKISISEKYPKLVKTRIRLNDNAWYFGPYISEKHLFYLMDIIKNNFKLRLCKNLKKKICLYYHLGLCSAPCEAKISEEDYSETLKSVKLLLDGKYRMLAEKITALMIDASNKLEYEQAEYFRKQLDAVKMLAEKQGIEDLNSGKSTDFFLILSFNEHYILQIARVKDGYLFSIQSYNIEKGIDETTVLEDGIRLFYEKNTDLPQIICLDLPEISEDFADYMKTLGIKVKTDVSQQNSKTMQILRENAYHNIKRQLIQKNDVDYNQIAGELKAKLKLNKLPMRIIGVDISHLGGTDIVASMVTFVQGIPEKNYYRRFNIKTVEDNNDVASIKEVVFRIFKSRNKYNPDLVLIDGGLGQLSASMIALESLAIKNQDILSLAKKEEIIYLPYCKEGVKLEKESNGLKILQQVRDEAHRFALKFQRSKRIKELI